MLTISLTRAIVQDRGRHAYAYLFASFMIELLAWSLPFSFGVFLNYFNNHPSQVNMERDSDLFAVVGTLATGIMYLSYPFVLRATSLYPWYCRHIMGVGLALCVAGLVGAAFSRAAWHFILTQGLIHVFRLQLRTHAFSRARLLHWWQYV
jgi:hypothetical protein